eukprot:jgi/Botrbrau1/18296/Bobra.0179s0026.1
MPLFPLLAMQGTTTGSTPPQQQIPPWGGGGWQAEAEEKDRGKISEIIYQMFEKKHNQQSNTDWQKRLPLFVKRLEEELFRTAASKAEYLDVSTLQARLHHAAAMLKQGGESRRLEAQALSDRLPGNGLSEASTSGQHFATNAGFTQQHDAVQILGRSSAGLSVTHHGGPQAMGMVAPSSGLHAPNRSAGPVAQQQQSPMGVGGMRLGPQSDSLYAIHQGGHMKGPDPGYSNGLINMQTMPERGLIGGRPDGNSIMGNGMPVMLRGTRDYPPPQNGYNLQGTAIAGNNNILIGGLQPPQLNNGPMTNGPSSMLQQYPPQRNGSLIGGMIPTGGATTMSHMGMVPMGPQMAPSMGNAPQGSVMLGTRPSALTSGSSLQMGPMALPASMSMAGDITTAQPVDGDRQRHQQQQQHMPGSRESTVGPQHPQQSRTQFVAKQQRWLLFLRHCAKCQAPDNQCQYGNSCTVAKQLWAHILVCSNPDCQYPRCVTSRELLKHHQKCVNMQCPVCVPVKEYVRRQRNEAHRRSQIEAQQNMLQQGHMGPQQTVNHARGQTNPHMGRPLPQMNPVPMGNAALSGLPPHAPGGSRHLGGVEGAPDLTGVASVSGTHMGDGPPLKRVKREIDHGASYEHVDAGQHRKAVSQKKGSYHNTGTSLCEMFTAEEIVRHLNNLKRAAENEPLLKKNDPTPSSIHARPTLDDGCTPDINACSCCLQNRLTWEPPSLYCSGCNQRIKRNQTFYVSSAKTDMRGYWCHACFASDPKSDSVEFEGQSVKKGTLEKKKNDEELDEGWVECDCCAMWVHQICGLFNKGQNNSEVKYHCPHCLYEGLKAGQRKRVEHRPQAWLEAKDLPQCDLSKYLEGYVADILTKERKNRAMRTGQPEHLVETADGLCIRVINNVEKNTDVKPRFSELFENEHYPRKFPYRQKVVLMTQKIDGVDVCLYCFYMQEYGDECSAPNRKWIYLSYLDSVKYFRPEVQVQTPQGDMALRTMVYHAVLQGYLQYAKQHGYCAMFIWACPPLQGDDYILYVHPQRQRVPRSDRLREWYLTCLRKSKADGVVTHTSNLIDTFFENGRDHRHRVSASLMPYFDGDYWPGEAEAQLANIAEESRNNGKKGSQTKSGGRSKSTKGKRYGCTAMDVDGRIMQNMADAINNMKEDFIVVHLQEPCSFCRKYISGANRWFHPDPPSKVTRADRTFEGINLDLPGLNGKQVTQMSRFQLCDECYNKEKSTLDANGRSEALPHNICLNHLKSEFVEEIPATSDTGNPDIPSEFFDTRQAFLSLCQGNHYQFDTLRRARHSSMMVLYHLHNPTEPAFAATCNNCNQEIEMGEGFRCTKCTDFDLCKVCKNAGVHAHHQFTAHDRSKVFKETEQRMTKENQEERKLQLDRTMKLLVHASSCDMPDCPSTNCIKVKNLFAHASHCKDNVGGGCTLCRRMWLLLQMHAKTCVASSCPVPKCAELQALRRRQAQRSEDARRSAYLAHIRNANAAAGGANAVQQHRLAAIAY